MATLTKSTGTVTLSGAVEKVTFPAVYGWVWVKNMSDSDMFVGLDDGISAGADGVLSIPAGECGRVQTDGQDSVYLRGTGNALVVAQNYADCPFKAGAKGGEIPVVYGENLLINPDFKINQRGITGTFSEVGKYFVDRWKLVSGTVTVNSDSSLTLNGTISQKFETPIDDNISITTSASAGDVLVEVATDSSGESKIISVEIMASGETISWVKMEYGKTATPFVPPEPIAELMKCLRFYERLFGVIGSGYFYSNTDCVIAASINPKRITPNIINDGTVKIWVQNNVAGVGIDATSVTIPGYKGNSVNVRMSCKVANGGIINAPCVAEVRTGGLILDAEIY